MASVYLETVLAGVAGAADDDVLALNMEGLEVVESDALQVETHDALEGLFSLRALHSDLAVVGAFVSDGHVIALGVALDPSDILVDVGSVDYEEVLVVVHLVDEQVIYSAAVFVAHHAVENLAVGRACHVANEYVHDILESLRAFDSHLAHVADIKHTHCVAHCVVFLGDSAVLYGHVETAEGFHLRTQFDMTVIKTRSDEFILHLSCCILSVIEI